LYASNLHRCPATYEAMKHLYDLAKVAKWYFQFVHSKEMFTFDS
jgi:hypothetical protein